MRPWLSRSLLVAGAFSICWIGAILYWRSTHRQPSISDLTLGMLILPLTLLVLAWFAKKMIDIALTQPAPSPTGGVTASSPSASDTSEPKHTPAYTPPLSLFASALRMPHGSSPEELRDAILLKQVQLELDPELTDAEGFPVMSARIATVNPQEQAEKMLPWLHQHAPTIVQFQEEQWRALALGSEVITELAQRMQSHPILPQFQAANPAVRGSLALPILRLTSLLPATWNTRQRLAANQWFAHLFEQSGWPSSHFNLFSAPVQKEVMPLEAIAQLTQQKEPGGLPCITIVLACESHISEESISDWETRGILFTAKNPHGHIPGEGAIGLLLADPTQAALIDPDSLVLLHNTRSGNRKTSADSSGRISSTLLSELSQLAMQAGAVEASQINLVTSDADQRTSRRSELLNMISVTLPELDENSQVISVAATNGSAGAVSTLAALVLASQHVAEHGNHALCVSNQDPYHRCAILLKPGNATPT